MVAQLAPEYRTHLKKVLSSVFYRGKYYVHIIRASKLKARPFFFFNFKGTPSQKEHKTIVSGLKISKMALSGQGDATALFFAVRYTLCDTYELNVIDCEFPQPVNSGKSIFLNLAA